MVVIQFVHPLQGEALIPLFGPYRYLHMVRSPEHQVGLWTPNHVECIARQSPSGGKWLSPHDFSYEEFIVRGVEGTATDEHLLPPDSRRGTLLLPPKSDLAQRSFGTY